MDWAHHGRHSFVSFQRFVDIGDSQVEAHAFFDLEIPDVGILVVVGDLHGGSAHSHKVLTLLTEVCGNANHIRIVCHPSYGLRIKHQMRPVAHQRLEVHRLQ